MTNAQPPILALGLLASFMLPLPALATDDPPGDPLEDAKHVAPQWGLGPLEVREPFLLALSRASPWARSPETLEHLQVEAGLRTVWTNHYGVGKDLGRFTVDGETRQVALSLRLGLLDRLELGLQVPYQWRGGGILDGFVEDWHSAFGASAQKRGRFPKNRYRVEGIESDGTTFQFDHRGYGFSDLVTELRGLVYEGDERLPAVALTLRLRLPTGRRKFDLSDGVDATLNVDLSKRLPLLPVFVYLGFAYTYYAHAIVDHVELTRDRLFFYLGLEWEVFDWLALVLHAWIESRRERKLYKDRIASRFSRPPIPRAQLTYGNYVSYIAFGIKTEPLEGLRVELGGLQNLLDPDVTADFSILFNISYRL